MSNRKPTIYDKRERDKVYLLMIFRNEYMIVPSDKKEENAEEDKTSKKTVSLKEPIKYMSKKKRKKMEKYIVSSRNRDI